MEARHVDDMYCFLVNSYKLFGVGRTFTSPLKFFLPYIMVQSWVEQ